MERRFSNLASQLRRLRLGFVLLLRPRHFQKQADCTWYSRTPGNTNCCAARGPRLLCQDPWSLPSSLRCVRSAGRAWSSPEDSTLLPTPAVSVLAASALDPTAFLESIGDPVPRGLPSPCPSWAPSHAKQKGHGGGGHSAGDLWGDSWTRLPTPSEPKARRLLSGGQE